MRYRDNFRVNATYFEGSTPKTIEGHCNDISEAGMGLLLPTEMSNGEVIGLNFSLAGSQEMWHLRAVVRYRHGYHYGVEFLSLSGAQRDSLRSHVTELKPAE